MNYKKVFLLGRIVFILALCSALPVFAKEKEIVSEVVTVAGDNVEAVCEDKEQSLTLEPEEKAVQKEGELALISPDAGSTVDTIMGMDIVALDGNTYHISDFSEDYIVVLFGRSGCGNTRGMAAEAADIRDKGASLKLIILSVDDTDDGLAAFASEKKAIGSLNPPYNNRTMWNLLGSENLASGSVTLPGSFVLDKSRNLIYCHTGYDASGLKDAIKIKTGSSYRNPVRNSDGRITWDCVWFGNYWQNDTNGDGIADMNDAKEPIKWRVLSATPDDLFIMSESLLDVKPYNTTLNDITWEESTIRSWLNGYDSSYNTCRENYANSGFVNAAFSGSEMAAIKTTAVNNANSQGYFGTYGGKNTYDKLYLLSYKEAIDGDYGFSTDCNTDDRARRAKVTPFARARGADVSTVDRYTGNGWWWLRSPGSLSNYAAAVPSSGCAGDSYAIVDYGLVSVRPALHISPSSSLLSYAGTICSDGTANELPPGSIIVENYSVTFKSNGGSSVSNQTVSKGGMAAKPSDPTRDGYTFTGWYTDQACTKAYDFNTAVTQSFTLYAGWEVKDSVTITPSTATIEIGQVIILTATVTSTNAADKKLTWSTSDSTIATVNDGVVTGVKAGKATITVKTEDGDKAAACDVTVTEKQQEGKSFVLGADNNHFANSYSGFFGDGVDRRYTFKHSDNLSQLKRLDSSKILGLEDWMKRAWGGSCFGIASTMGLVKLGKLSVDDITRSGAGSYHSLQKPASDSILFDAINYYQVGQAICKKDTAIAGTYDGNKDTLKSFLRSFVESTKGNNIVLFCYGDSKSGHAILALNSEYDPGGDRYIVTVYDENTAYGQSGAEPEHTSEFIVSSDFSSFDYTTASNKVLQNIYTRMHI